MDASVSVSIGSILAVVGFLLQAGITIGAIAYSHGQLSGRVRAVEEKVKDHGLLATSVTRLETEMEGVCREIKGLREDLRIARNEIRYRPQAARPVQTRRASPYEFAEARDWVLEDEQ